MSEKSEWWYRYPLDAEIKKIWPKVKGSAAMWLFKYRPPSSFIGAGQQGNTEPEISTYYEGTEIKITDISIVQGTVHEPFWIQKDSIFNIPGLDESILYYKVLDFGYRYSMQDGLALFIKVLKSDVFDNFELSEQNIMYLRDDYLSINANIVDDENISGS